MEHLPVPWVESRDLLIFIHSFIRQDRIYANCEFSENINIQTWKGWTNRLYLRLLLVCLCVWVCVSICTSFLMSLLYFLTKIFYNQEKTVHIFVVLSSHLVITSSLYLIWKLTTVLPKNILKKKEVEENQSLYDLWQEKNMFSMSVDIWSSLISWPKWILRDIGIRRILKMVLWHHKENNLFLVCYGVR